MTQIKARGLPIIDEDGLFEMIRTLPAQVVTQSPSKKKPKSSAKLTNISTTSSFMLSTATSATTTTSLPGERSTSTSSQLWTEKYRPASVKEIIGNPGAIKELITWLKNFQQESAEENSAEMKKKKEKTGSEPVAALISGPPGIGTAPHFFVATVRVIVCDSVCVIVCVCV
jgi:replication factor C subunit 1